MLKIETSHLQKETIDKTVPTDFIGIHEDDLSFVAPVSIQGEASIMDDLFILKLSVKTALSLPCSICNKQTTVPLEIKEFYHTISISELPHPFFDYTDLLREELVLLIPQFTECKNGKCPERVSLSKTPKEPSNHFPFADL